MDTILQLSELAKQKELIKTCWLNIMPPAIREAAVRWLPKELESMAQEHLDNYINTLLDGNCESL
ncbi:unknown [Singapore grouper iridovirus]|uniref:Uncharacterized protein n=1 Tax=Singapore grouper iridovirus TaxID=262968 RepID=Q5YFC7_9VIRU|nr:hypothetical protein ORF138L [Singapore grouper iridovirus]AAS18153.1 unknown [Singapore grouper iridovirus]WAU86847.1 hypothetical protein ORF138L [Singapore grouper iridovirus]